MASESQTRRQFLKTAGLAGAAAVSGVGCGSMKSSFAGATGDVRPEDKPTARRDGDGELSPADELLEATEGLFRPTHTGCVVQWVARGECEASVLAGRTAGKLAEVRRLTSAGPTEATIDGFAPDSEFYLRCRFRAPGTGAWIERPTQCVRTQPTPGSSFRAAIIADTHARAAITKPGGLENTRAAIAAVLRDKPDFVVFVGDEACLIRRLKGDQQVDPEKVHDTWRQWRWIYAELLAAIPSFLVLGNHEGEAGFYQAHGSGGRKPQFLQRYATIMRKRFVANPLPETYPEGGENDGWVGDPESAATGGAADGNCSPLQNYYAWTWGDALFVALDVHRYTQIGEGYPTRPNDWTLGPAQFSWLESVLRASRAKWKFVIGHHLVGGWPWDKGGQLASPGSHAYARGGGCYARVGEQAAITDLMNSTNARFYLYGHDHIFCHQHSAGVEFLCCGKASGLNPDWYKRPGWYEAYGRYEARDPNDFYAALGYTRLSVSPERTVVEYIRTAVDVEGAENVDTPVGQAVCRAEFT